MDRQFFIGPILIVGLLVAALALFLVRLPAVRAGRSGRRHRHVAVRWICGLVALVLIAAVVMSSWQATSPEVMNGGTALVLAPGGDAIPELDEPRERDDIGEVRFIYTVLVIGETAGVKTVHDGASVVIDWPDDRGRTKTLEGAVSGGEFNASVTIDEIWATSEGSTAWQVSGHHRMSYQTRQSSGMRSGGLSMGDAVDTKAIGWRRMIRAPLSLVPTRVSGQQYLVTHLTPAHKGDPIEMTASEWLESKRGMINPEMRSAGSFASRESNLPNGVRMLGYTGPASLLLLLAAALMAQLFRSRLRAPAFVAALLAFVLLAIGLDRVMVERHAERLAQEGLDDAGREQVMMRMEQSFFHAGHVEKILSEREG